MIYSKFEIVLSFEMQSASVQDLPNEIAQEILFKLPACSVLDACEIFPEVCNLNFWATKAKKDFGVSTEYFYLPLKNIGGFGTFQEIPKFENSLWGESKIVFRKKTEMSLNRGAFRYFQIANRFSLLPIAMHDETQYSKYGFIESPMFYIQADRMNQLDLVPSLVSFSSPNFLSYSSLIFNDFSTMAAGFFSLYRQGIESSHFRHAVAERIFSSGFVNEMTQCGREWPKETEGISNGVIPPRLVKEISQNIYDQDLAYKFRTIVEEILELGDERLLPAICETIDKLIKFCPTAGPILLHSAIQGGNMASIKEVLKHGDFFNGIDPDFGEPYCNAYTYDRAAYFSGDFEIVRFVCGKCPSRFPLGNVTNIQIESFINGYRHHRKPERFLECLTHFSLFLSDEQVAFLCSLKDCDIAAHLLEVSIAQSELTVVEAAQKFIEANFYCFIGHLDLIAWAMRVLKKLFGSSPIPEFNLVTERRTKLIVEERYDYVWEEDDKFLKELGKRCWTSERMFREGMRKN